MFKESKHPQIVRAAMAIFYIVVGAYCLVKDPASHNTLITMTATIVTGLYGAHTVSSYFSSTDKPD
jgi:hypothetical protein